MDNVIKMPNERYFEVQGSFLLPVNLMRPQESQLLEDQCDGSYVLNIPINGDLGIRVADTEEANEIIEALFGNVKKLNSVKLNNIINIFQKD